MQKYLLALFIPLLSVSASFAQGTVSFKNYFGNVNTDPAVYFSGGLTRVSGSQYLVGLMAGPSIGSEAQIATTTFLTQAGAAGFFQGGTVSIPNVAGGGVAWISIKVWDTTLNGTTTGATFAQAESYSAVSGLPNLWGSSIDFTVVTGDPNANPPTVPAFLVPGLSSFTLVPVPEPSTLALAALSASTLILFRRRS